ncbi:phosphatidate phosphatase PAH1-like [Salvia miltiorrhiza]|uniref:phosphatidate phosphatase PAH1-like n=1 Tax=Salvia miltiorrhiza TaxID=226208 RepID=UPI0025ABF9EF|nr:phosphatidate phosphatase PAH1-like [Salvia miltiorrhiza]XP_057778997.1 phosphatidate phosphatase PAH1-like [Salvia miltiorrhiza]
MDVVGKVSSIITQGMYSVATPFHPFGGAVDIIVVKQQDGTFRSTPWYVRFGKFQGVLKGAEKVVQIEVNDVEADFHMYLDNSGEAYFVREVDDVSECLKDLDNLEGGVNSNHYNSFNEGDLSGQDADGMPDTHLNMRAEKLRRVESDAAAYVFYEFSDEHSSVEGSPKISEHSPSRYDTLDSVEHALELQESNSEVVLVSVDGHILTAPISSSEKNGENVQLSTPQFHLGPGGGTEEYSSGEGNWASDCLSDAHKVGDTCETNSLSSEHHRAPCEGDEEHMLHAGETEDKASGDKELCIESSPDNSPIGLKKKDIFKSCLELSQLATQSTNVNQENVCSSTKNDEATEDSHNKSPRSSSRNYETEKTNNEISKTNDELSSSDSGCPITVSLPDLQVEAATHGKDSSSMDNDGCSDRMSVQIASNDQGSQEQVDVNLDGKRNRRGIEDPAPEVESSKGKLVRISTQAPLEYPKSDTTTKLEISLCGNLLHAGMGSRAADDAFDANLISLEEFKASGEFIMKNKNLIVRLQGKYLPWRKSAHIVLGIAAYDLELPVNPNDVIPVDMGMTDAEEDESGMPSTPSRRWRLWPIPFRRVKTLEHTSSMSSNEEAYLDSEAVSPSHSLSTTPGRPAAESPRKQIIRTNVPTTDQIASLNLKEGQNMVNFVFSTRVLGPQKVEAHIYLWKWNTRIVISDVDGTITKSDVLGQFMPLVGKDWTHSGIAHLFSAIKENGYQLLFLSARAIVQSYLTKSFLFNLKQDGKSLPTGPVVISPDGLFPSLYREVIRRAPHEFKIACLEDIKALFPPDYNPFYAGFGNRDTDELSYRKIGIPKGKIFIINPKGEVAINHCIDLKSYNSLHTLVNDMFPPTSLVEQEDYNSWNYWKMPLFDLDNM